MMKSTKDLNNEIAKLRAAARAAEKAEYEGFGRWVVDQLAASAKGAASERIEAARSQVRSAVVDDDPRPGPGHDSRSAVGHGDAAPGAHSEPGAEAG